MIASASTDYREAAKRRLFRFLFDHIDGAAVTERTMKQNVEEARRSISAKRQGGTRDYARQPRPR
jgi:hypothetical protein